MVIIHANVAAVEVQHFSILMKPNLKRNPESCVQPESIQICIFLQEL